MATLDEEGAPELLIDVQVDHAGAALVVLCGELDSSNAGELDATLGALGAGRPERLRFELRDLRFMDSAGIAVLVSAAARAESVTLLNPTPVVRRVIEVTGLAGVLGMEP